MELYETIPELSKHLQGVLSTLGQERYLIGVAGVPGSGKTTLVSTLVEHVNRDCGNEVCASLPMDGFHFYRHQLDKMPNPTEAHKRRGTLLWCNTKPQGHHSLLMLKAYCKQYEKSKKEMKFWFLPLIMPRKIPSKMTLK